MEFSWSYEDTMRRLAVNSSNGTFSGMVSGGSSVYSLMMVVDLKDTEFWEIPILAYNRFSNIYNQNNDLVDTKIVLPLNIVNWNKVCAGAETMLKYFNRESSGRLVKCSTPKGEVYYGNNGLIMDKDFTPLMLSTIKVPRNISAANNFEYTVYFHPKVFTDDTGIINKSLAKKGIAFYLSRKVDDWRNTGDYKVKIEDPSKYIINPHKPDVNHCSSKDFNGILKNNIDEVLKQIIHDHSRYI